MTQGQRLNFKWTMADVDRVREMVRHGGTADSICRELADTTLASTPAEIICMMHDMGVHVPRINRRYGR